MSRYRKHRHIFLIACVAFLLGAVSFIAFRMATYKSDEVHYHANFAMYVNGKRETFDGFAYYEEVQACVDHNADNPKSRVHMHDRNNGLIHVHGAGMTWGYFFNNLGFTIGNTVLATEEGTFIDGQDGKQLTFILNGEKVSSIAGKIIKSEDKLLISYGDEDQKSLFERAKTLPSDAHKANTEHDPSTCSGGHNLNFWERLRAVTIE